MKKAKPGPTDVPIYNDAVTRVSGKDLRELNLRDTKTIAHAISPSLGPKGFSKIIAQPTKDINVTHKGHEITRTFRSRLPIVQMLIKLVETQENTYGDGTKTVVLLTGLLLEKAANLLAQGIPPQIIHKGYSLATEKALQVLEANAISFNPETEPGVLRNIFSSVMTNILSNDTKQHFATLLLKMLKDHANLFFTSKDFDFSDLLFRKIAGRGVVESEIIEGMIIYKAKPNPSTPSRIENARILLVSSSMDFFPQGNFSTQREAKITSPAKLKEFGHFNQDYYRNLAISFQNKGVNVVLCEKKMNEDFISICEGLGMIALELVGEQELKKLSKLLNVIPVAAVTKFSDKDVGKAELAEFKKVTSDEMLFLRNKNASILTLLVRGGTKNVLDELEESLRSSLKVAIQTIKDGKVLPGAGALECEIAGQLKKYAATFANTLQLAITDFGTAFENIPSYLIANSGLDPLEIIPQLRSSHGKGKKHDGFDGNTSSIVNVVKAGILDGYSVKKQSLKMASELACQTIRVDDLIMVYDRKMYERIKEEGKPRKMEKREEEMRKYLQKHERDFVPS